MAKFNSAWLISKRQFHSLTGIETGTFSALVYKKAKNRPLTRKERAYNHALSRFRVRVEHAIARLKSFRILSERYRYPPSKSASWPTSSTSPQGFERQPDKKTGTSSIRTLLLQQVY